MVSHGKRSIRPRGDDVPVCTETIRGHYCGKRHLSRYGTQACVGHVITDRSTYDPTKPRGKQRELLPEPVPCKQLPWTGQTCCRAHGATGKRQLAAAERRETERKAKALMLTLGEPVEGDPAEIIAERIAARNGHVRWLLARVQALEPEALTWGRTKRKRGGHDTGTTHEAKPSIWYALYVDAADKLERLCIDAMRVGLLERQVRMDERMADMWVRVIDGMLADLGHDPNDPETAQIVARHLELVA